MKWYLCFPILSTVFLGLSPIAQSAEVIKGPTNARFTVESLPNGNYRLCSDRPPSDIQRVSGVCFRFRKQGKDILGEYYYPYKGSRTCITGKVNNNTVTGQSVETIPGNADMPSDLPRQDTMENWGQDGFLQVGRAQLETEGSINAIRYRSTLLHLKDFYQFNLGQSKPPQNCTTDTQEMANLPTANEIEYQLYTNPRFYYRVKYPANILTPQPPPANGDGREFQSTDGQITMRVYGSHNALSESLNERYQQVLQQDSSASNREVTYRSINDNFFVVSGYRGNMVFYRKTIFDNNMFKTLELSYHRSFQPEFDSVVAEIASSFKSTNAGLMESFR